MKGDHFMNTTDKREYTLEYKIVKLHFNSDQLK